VLFVISSLASYLLVASRSLACSLQASHWPACSEQVIGLLTYKDELKQKFSIAEA
jgi:hypothetical protein